MLNSQHQPKLSWAGIYRIGTAQGVDPKASSRWQDGNVTARHAVGIIFHVPILS
jgi:hypothetical protein